MEEIVVKPIAKDIQITDKVKLTKHTVGSFVYYKSDNGVRIPREIIDKIIQKTYTPEDVQSWFSSSDSFKGFGAEDEIRSELLSIIPLDEITEIFNFEVIDKITGTDLYKKYPIGTYIQQGDVLAKPAHNKDRITYEELSSTMKIRLESNVYYELLQGKVFNEPFKALKMTNASLYAQRKEIHIEPVSDECETVFDAIKWRNDADCLPCELS